MYFQFSNIEYLYIEYELEYLGRVEYSTLLTLYQQGICNARR